MSIRIFSGAVTGNKVDESMSFDPNRLFDALINKLHLKNDATLSCLLGVVPSVINNLRNCRLKMDASLLTKICEVSDMTIAELCVLIGDGSR